MSGTISGPILCAVLLSVMWQAFNTCLMITHHCIRSIKVLELSPNLELPISALYQECICKTPPQSGNRVYRGHLLKTSFLSTQTRQVSSTISGPLAQHPTAILLPLSVSPPIPPNPGEIDRCVCVFKGRSRLKKHLYKH